MHSAPHGLDVRATTLGIRIRTKFSVPFDELRQAGHFCALRSYTSKLPPELDKGQEELLARNQIYDHGMMTMTKEGSWDEENGCGFLQGTLSCGHG